MIGFLATGLAVYAALVGVLFVFQRNLMYYPAGGLYSPSESGVPEMTAFEATTADGLTLTSWIGKSQAGKPTVVYFQGNAGAIDGRGSKVRPYLDAGLGVVLVGYRGYGGNPGTPTERGLYADGRAVLEHLRSIGIGPKEWIFYGESLGSGVAVQLAYEEARRQPIASLVLEAPFTSMGDAAAAHYPFVPARTLVRDRFRSIDKIAAVETPLLIIHGDPDGTVPTRLGRRLFAAAVEPKRAHWLASGGHNNLYDFGAAALVLQFISDLPVVGQFEK